MTEHPTRKVVVTSIETPIRVRYPEVDRQGAVHHSRYAVYYEIGRVELLRANGMDYKTIEDEGVMLVIAKLETRFKSPAFYDDELMLTTRLTVADHVRHEHQYELVRPADNKLLAVGSSTLVHVDKEGKLSRFPEFLTPPEGWQDQQ